jgi:hypothetical protein
MMLAATPTITRAGAEELGLRAGIFETAATINALEIAGIAFGVGLFIFAVTAAILYLRLRARTSVMDASLNDDIIALRAERDRVNTMLLAEPQIVVTWGTTDGEPDILGDTTLITSAELPQRVLAFGSWLEPDKAQAMERAADALRSNGESVNTSTTSVAVRGLCAMLRY